MIAKGKKTGCVVRSVLPDNPAGFQIGWFFAVHILVVSSVCGSLYGCFRAVTATCGVGANAKNTHFDYPLVSFRRSCHCCSRARPRLTLEVLRDVSFVASKRLISLLCKAMIFCNCSEFCLSTTLSPVSGSSRSKLSSKVFLTAARERTFSIL